MREQRSEDWAIPPKLWPAFAVSVVLCVVVLWKFLNSVNPTP